MAVVNAGLSPSRPVNAPQENATTAAGAGGEYVCAAPTTGASTDCMSSSTWSTAAHPAIQRRKGFRAGDERSRGYFAAPAGSFSPLG